VVQDVLSPTFHPGVSHHVGWDTTDTPADISEPHRGSAHPDASRAQKRGSVPVSPQAQTAAIKAKHRILPTSVLPEIAAWITSVTNTGPSQLPCKQPVLMNKKTVFNQC
jgi:hypothetical protein